MSEAVLNEAGSEPSSYEAPADAPVDAPVEETPTIPDDNWYSALPEEVQQWQEVQNSPDPATFFKQMGDMRSMIGRSIRPPGPDAGKEAWDKFHKNVMDKSPHLMLKPDSENLDALYDQLGRPEAPDQYKIDEIDGMDNTAVDNFRPIAHKHGLTQKQFEGIVAEMTGITGQRNEQIMQEHQEQLQSLKGEWGMAYDQNMQLAEKVRQDYFPQLQMPIEKMDAHSIASLHKLGKALGGEGVNLVKESGTNAAMTPSEAQDAINDIMSNTEHPYWNKSHPAHKSAIEKMLKLHEYRDAKG